MPKLIGEHWEGDVRVRWWGNEADNTITIERWQDNQGTLDHVAEVNAIGAATHDGLGKPVAEIPVSVAMEFCDARGIPWEKFLYTNEYDDQFKRFARQYSKLTYANNPSVHTVQ
jgi:hypothetical protein